MNRLLGAVAVIVPMVLAAPAVAVAPPSLDTDHAVGKTLERVGAKLPKLPSAPLEQKAPSPAPASEAPAARPQAAPAPTPAGATAPSSAPMAKDRSPAVRSASAPRARSSAVPSKAKASGGTAAASDPTDAVQADSSAPEQAETATAATSASPGSLPFTGSTMLPVLLVAVALVLAGIGLKQAARVRA